MIIISFKQALSYTLTLLILGAAGGQYLSNQFISDEAAEELYSNNTKGASTTDYNQPVTLQRDFASSVLPYEQPGNQATSADSYTSNSYYTSPQHQSQQSVPRISW